jgi:hypothetical protein
LLVGDAARGGDKKQKNTREVLISLLFDVKKNVHRTERMRRKMKKAKKQLASD